MSEKSLCLTEISQLPFAPGDKRITVLRNKAEDMPTYYILGDIAAGEELNLDGHVAIIGQVGASVKIRAAGSVAVAQVSSNNTLKLGGIGAGVEIYSKGSIFLEYAGAGAKLIAIDNIFAGEKTGASSGQRNLPVPDMAKSLIHQTRGRSGKDAGIIGAGVTATAGRDIIFDRAGASCVFKAGGKVTGQTNEYSTVSEGRIGLKIQRALKNVL